MRKIYPCLWFDHQAEEAVDFYVSIFKNSQVLKVARYGAEGAKVSGKPEGSVMTIDFELNGESFTALNGGPIFAFSHAISLVVDCEDQEEVDYFWAKLSEGGSEEPCGWLKDKYGVSWQVVPRVVGEWMAADPRGAERVMQAMVKMRKIDIETLKRAYDKA